MVIRPLSTRLIKPNFPVSLSHRRRTTVSLETRNLGKYWSSSIFFASYQARSVNLQKWNGTTIFPVRTEQASSIGVLLYWFPWAWFSIPLVFPLRLLLLTVLEIKIRTFSFCLRENRSRKMGTVWQPIYASS